MDFVLVINIGATGWEDDLGMQMERDWFCFRCADSEVPVGHPGEDYNRKMGI